MNWLGKIIQKEIKYDDSVLSVGCGILQDINGLDCKSLFGIDIYEPYINKLNSIGVNAICADVTKYEFKEKFDIVLALDIIEHLEKDDAIDLIKKMKSIANKKVIIYTPSYFFDNISVNYKGEKINILEWLNNSNVSPYKNLGINKFQEHKCFISEEELIEFGFFTSTDNIDNNVYAIWENK